MKGTLQKFNVRRRNNEIGQMPEENACQYVHARLILSLGWLSALETAASKVEEAKSKGEATIRFTDYLGQEDWINLRLLND